MSVIEFFPLLPAVALAAYFIFYIKAVPAIVWVTRQHVALWPMPVIAGMGMFLPLYIDNPMIPRAVTTAAFLAALGCWLYLLDRPGKLPHGTPICANCGYEWPRGKPPSASPGFTTRCSECGGRHWIRLKSSKGFNIRTSETGSYGPRNLSPAFWLLAGASVLLPFLGIALAVAGQWVFANYKAQDPEWSLRLIRNGDESLPAAAINATVWIAATIPACWCALEASRTKYRPRARHDDEPNAS